MKHLLILLITGLLLVQCAIDRTIEPVNKTELETLATFKNFDAKNRVRISNENEPGEPLWLCLTFVSKETGKPLFDQEVHFYHTSTSGEYEPSNPADESTARLNGSVITNGRVKYLCKPFCQAIMEVRPTTDIFTLRFLMLIRKLMIFILLSIQVQWEKTLVPEATSMFLQI